MSSTLSRIALSRVTRVAFLVACLVIVIAGIRSAASIIAPFLLAAFIAAISLPLLDWLRRMGARTSVAIIAVVLMNALVLSFLGWVVLQSVTELRAALPDYVARGQVLEGALRERLGRWGVQIGPDYYATFVQPERLFEMATSAARNVTSVLAVGLLVLLYMVFMLAESVAFPAKWRVVFGEHSHGIGGAADALRQVQRYLALKTVASLLTGVAVGVGAWLLGVDFALLWGFLAFVLNYVPSIGSIVAAIPALLIALLQFGPGRALGLGAVYLVVNFLVGNLADPIIIGRHLRLSPIIVLVSLVFWGWTLGLVGMFLAVPLTIAIRIILENSDSLARYALLMGPLPPLAERPLNVTTAMRTPSVPPAGVAPIVD